MEIGHSSQQALRGAARLLAACPPKDAQCGNGIAHLKAE
ncbi:hypothetical protein XOC_0817 [Xanthomonas oryzae pv. oryzicola BLS256]|uniref:Uncharacterized protein n=1 Tax=Xanthomonas oryzae pv. oryzicola (strain BLS256) TaxID=383407 RepID=G7TD77_XANOB|nr:hypothetical protein XOC_0817 [Xanthomonas oryzae pv. oryzicola BLS256]QEO99113.1 hypothetical protein XOCgx_4126 [Xanthomonas oryzae pv. oryzicola]